MTRDVGGSRAAGAGGWAVEAPGRASARAATRASATDDVGLMLRLAAREDASATAALLGRTTGEDRACTWAGRPAARLPAIHSHHRCSKFCKRVDGVRVVGSTRRRRRFTTFELFQALDWSRRVCGSRGTHPIDR